MNRFAGAALALVALSAAAAPDVKIVGGRVYRARIDAGGARVALFRYAAAARGKTGPPVLVLPELGFDHRWYEMDGAGLAPALQALGREVFVLEWRGTGASDAPPLPSQPRSAPGGRPLGSEPLLASLLWGLDALFLGDAVAALEAVLAARPGEQVQLVGQGLGGAAAVLLAAGPRAASISALVLLSVPAAYAVPNEAVRRLIASARNVEAAAPATLALAEWAAFPPPLLHPARPDLFALLLAHGTKLAPEREQELRAWLAPVPTQLLRDVARWMEQGDLRLEGGPLAPGDVLSAAYGRLTLPLLAVAAPLDNLVHLEHALAVRRLAPHALREELVLSQLEGFPEDAGHLAPQAPWAGHALYPRLFAFLEAHR